MKKREILEIELDNITVNSIQKNSKELNMSENEYINEVLEDYISKKITLGDYLKLLQNYEDNSSDKDFLKNFYIIVDDFYKPLLKIRPYTEE